MESKKIKFDDLVFKAHSVVKGGVMAYKEFEDGSYLSIVGGGVGLYGNGTTSFEVMSNRTHKQMGSDGVRGWIGKEKINRMLNYIQKNPLK